MPKEQKTDETKPTTNPEPIETPEPTETPAPDDRKEKSEDPKPKDDNITISKDDLSNMIKKRVAKAVAEKEEAQKEAKRLASLSDDERAKEEIKKAQSQVTEYKQQIEQLKAEQQRYNLTKEATKQLSNKGINATDEVLNMLVGLDAETTNNNIKAYAQAIADNTEKAKKEMLKGKAPKTTNIKDNGKLSIEDRINANLNKKG